MAAVASAVLPFAVGFWKVCAEFTSTPCEIRRLRESWERCMKGKLLVLVGELVISDIGRVDPKSFPDHQRAELRGPSSGS
jgi:hypothetical protein